MAYVKNTWVDGDIVTSEKLNHMEDGIEAMDMTDSIAKGSGKGAVIEGNLEYNEASGENSHAEGEGTKATEDLAHAEGHETTASGYGAHAEGGQGTKATGDYSHAEGWSTQAKGDASHSEGFNSKADGDFSHAGGSGNATGDYSFAHGCGAEATGRCSASIGWYTKANNDRMFVCGRFNEPQEAKEEWDDDEYLFVVGAGREEAQRYNAFAVSRKSAIICGITITREQIEKLLALIQED